MTNADSSGSTAGTGLPQAESGSGHAQPEPRRIQLSRKRGWKMPANTVKVDRSTRWGNPVRSDYPDVAVNLFQSFLDTDGQYLARVTGQGTFVITVEQIRTELRGKNLACWCALDKPCHADVLLRAANAARTSTQPSQSPSGGGQSSNSSGIES